MNSLRLEINIGTDQQPDWQTAYLDEDESIDIEENSPLWNDASTYSYGFKLPFEPNRHILGNVDELYGSSIYRKLYHKPFRLWVCGILWLCGTIDMDDETDLDGTAVEINLVSGNRVLDDILEDIKANDVEIYTNIDDLAVNPNSPSVKEQVAQKQAFDKNIQIGWSHSKEASVLSKYNINAEIAFSKDDNINWHNNTDIYVYCPQVGGKRERISGRDFWNRKGIERIGDGIPFDIPQFMVPETESETIPTDVDSRTSFVNSAEIYEPNSMRMHPYCNMRVCSQLYRPKEDAETDNNKIPLNDGDWEKRRGYQTLYTRIEDQDGSSVEYTFDPFDESRMQSSPCFFVLFWMEVLLKEYLHISYDISNLLNTDDIRALCFINPKCKYKADPHADIDKNITSQIDISNIVGDKIIKVGESGDRWQINVDHAWSNIPAHTDTQDAIHSDYITYKDWSRDKKRTATLTSKRLFAGAHVITDKAEGLRSKYDYSMTIRHEDIEYGSIYSFAVPTSTGTDYLTHHGFYFSTEPSIESSSFQPGMCFDISIQHDIGKDGNQQSYSTMWFVNSDGKDVRPTLQRAFATADNFPDVEAKEVFQGIETAFGAKFMYIDERNHIEVVFFKDVLSQDRGEEIDCIISDVFKRENNVRGFRLKYASASDKSKNKLTGEQNIVSGGDDTTFFYNDYKQKSGIKGEVKMIQDGGNVDYCTLIRMKNAEDMNLYISAITGNAYRWKVDSNSSKPSEWYPSLFEVASHRSVEIGDCRDDDTIGGEIIEITIPFNPVIPNDVNVENQLKMSKDSEVSAAIIDSDGNKTYNNYPEYRIFCDIEYHDRHSFGQIDLLTPLMTQMGKDESVAGYYKELFDEYLVMVKQEGWMTNENGEVEGYPLWSFGSDVVSLGNPDNEPQYNLYLRNLRWYDESDSEYNPFNNIDMGFTLGFLRPGTRGTNNIVVDHDSFDYDNERNYKCSRVYSSGSSQITSDSCDVYGNVYGLSIHGILIAPGEYTKSQAAEYISNHFSESNANLMATARKKAFSDMKDHRWYTLTDYTACCPQIYRDPRFADQRYLLTPITDSGVILTPAELGAYWDKLIREAVRPTEILERDKSDRRLIIGHYDNDSQAENYGQVLEELMQILHCGATRIETGLVSPSTHESTQPRLSLKLKAEKPWRGDERPFRRTTREEWLNTPMADRTLWPEYVEDTDKYYVIDYEHGNPLYYPINDRSLAKRGLYDRYWTEYAHFVIHRKVAVITIPRGGISIVTLRAIKFKKRYRFGIYDGWINKMAYAVDKMGLGDVTIELYYM